MPISEFIWTLERVEHIARHGVIPEEFEDACRGVALILRTKAKGKSPVYHVLGQTLAGRYLLCVVIHFPDGRGYPVTARPMNPREKRRYQQWKRR